MTVTAALRVGVGPPDLFDDFALSLEVTWIRVKAVTLVVDDDPGTFPLGPAFGTSDLMT